MIDDIIILIIFSLAQSAETSALRTLAVKSANPHLSRSCDLGLLSLLKDARFLSWNYCGSNSHLIDFFQSRWKALMHVAFIGGSYHEVTLRRCKTPSLASILLICSPGASLSTAVLPQLSKLTIFLRRLIDIDVLSPSALAIPEINLPWL